MLIFSLPRDTTGHMLSKDCTLTKVQVSITERKRVSPNSSRLQHGLHYILHILLTQLEGPEPNAGLSGQNPC